MTELNTSCVVYPDELEKEIIKNKYIPRKCRELEHLKLYHRYYTTIYGVFKVEYTRLFGVDKQFMMVRAKNKNHKVYVFLLDVSATEKITKLIEAY